MVGLANRIHAIINNSNFDVADVRLILQGRKIGNPSQQTQEIPITLIQGVGKCLREGKSIKQTSRDMKVSVDLVEGIEDYLGIRSQYRSKQIDDAVIAAREGVSVRNFAKQLDIPRTTAHRLLVRGTEILKELGEI
jgi:hypothetical protein